MTQPMTLAHVSRSSAQPVSRPELTSVLLGPSAAMTQLWAQLRRLAPHVRCVLLTGKPNCGQEAAARLLLELSHHRQRSFVTLTAAEIDERLLRGGLASLPLDALVYVPDLDAVSAEGQAELLRLLRLRRTRVFTLVAASTADLKVLVSGGRFLPELAEALGSVQVALPALSQRQEDLPMLLLHLLSAELTRQGRRIPQLSKEFLRAAMKHSWSGNLDELGRTVSAIAGRRLQEELTASDLTLALAAQPNHLGSQPASPAVRLVSLDTIAREHIYAVLRACRGNKLRAAEVLGISRSTLYRMLEVPTVTVGSQALAN